MKHAQIGHIRRTAGMSDRKLLILMMLLLAALMVMSAIPSLDRDDAPGTSGANDCSLGSSIDGGDCAFFVLF